jgi:hypothetical protein
LPTKNETTATIQKRVILFLNCSIYSTEVTIMDFKNIKGFVSSGNSQICSNNKSDTFLSDFYDVNIKNNPDFENVSESEWLERIRERDIMKKERLDRLLGSRHDSQS